MMKMLLHPKIYDQWRNSGKDGYQMALVAMEEAYGRPRLVYSNYVKAILTPDSYTYNWFFCAEWEILETHLRGLEQYNRYTLEQF